MTNKGKIPEGYRQNAQGHLVHEDDIREHDKLRDALVNEYIERARQLNALLAKFKADALQDIEDLVAISAERYGISMGGKKGNVQLVSFDGRYKIARSVQEVITFSEEIIAAKQLIDACIVRWSQDANPHIRTLVDQAFHTNGQGQIKTTAVLGLMRLEIDDDDWHTAMDALRDALHVLTTSTYVRLYERVGNSNNWRAITLDLASV